MKRFKELFESPPGLITPMDQSFTKSAHGPKARKKKMEEQHREKGRFKPTIPHNVPNVLAATPKKMDEDFGKPTPSVEEVAKKHGVSVDVINKQLEAGIKVEKEHTNDVKMAREIALDHLNEKPDYYSKLKKYVESLEEDCWDGYKQVGLKKKGNRMVPNCVKNEMTDIEYQSAGTGARTLVDKPNKEPIKKYKDTVKEDLRNWFDPNHPKGGWKRINSKGEAIGPCAREPGEPKPKCMSNEKRAELTKKERAAAVSAKRRHDPNPERKGKPINVSNFGKGKLSEHMEQLDEKNEPTNPELWSRAKALAKSKFDVYPSAYANGWAAKWYKSKGGGWKSVSEEVEKNVHDAIKKIRKLDEISPELKSRYKEKAEKAVKEVQPWTQKGEYKDLAKNLIKRRQKGLAMVKEQNDTQEKNEMVESQLHFIKYACEEIIEFMKMGGKIEEWYQVKVAKVFSDFESLHAYMEGESRRLGMKEETEDLNEMDKSQPTPGRDERISHSTYGSRDKKGSDYFKGKESPGKPISRKQMGKDALEILKKQGLAEGSKEKDPIWNKGTPMPKDYTCHCGLYVHPSRRNPKAIHASDCPYAKKQDKEQGVAESLKTPADYEKLAKKHTADGQKGTRANMVYASKMAGRARRAAEILKKGGSQEDAMRHYQSGSLHESRKAEIVKEIMKNKKNEKDNSEKFQKDPELSSEITKA